MNTLGQRGPYCFDETICRLNAKALSVRILGEINVLLDNSPVKI